VERKKGKGVKPRQRACVSDVAAPLGLQSGLVSRPNREEKCQYVSGEGSHN
jgi:hypothetical protein